MVTYVLGAGASVHAGYPLASNLGNELRKWLHATKPPTMNTEFTSTRFMSSTAVSEILKRF